MTNQKQTKGWAVERRLSGSPNQIFRLGSVALRHDGYWFISNVAAHRGSRKAHPTLEAALPRWVGYPDHCETREI